MEDDSARDVAFREAYQSLDTSPHGPATLSHGGTAKVPHPQDIVTGWVWKQKFVLEWCKTESIAGADLGFPARYWSIQTSLSSQFILFKRWPKYSAGSPRHQGH